MRFDCYDFYLWSIGKLSLKNEPDLTELFLTEEEL